MEDVKYVTRVSLIVKCISILPIFVVVRKPEDFTWVMFFFALETVLSGILALGIAINKYKLLWVRVSFNDVVYYFKDSFPFFTSMFLTRVYQTSNTFILGVVCGDFVTGIYSAAEKLHNVYTSLITPLIEDIFYPYFSRIKDIVKINMMVLSIIALNLFIIISCIFGWQYLKLTQYQKSLKEQKDTLLYQVYINNLQEQNLRTLNKRLKLQVVQNEHKTDSLNKLCILLLKERHLTSTQKKQIVKVTKERNTVLSQFASLKERIENNSIRVNLLKESIISPQKVISSPAIFNEEIIDGVYDEIEESEKHKKIIDIINY